VQKKVLFFVVVLMWLAWVNIFLWFLLHNTKNKSTKIGGYMWIETVNSTGCFKKVAPPPKKHTFWTIFTRSLRLSLFAWNVANLLAFHIDIYLPIFVDFHLMGEYSKLDRVKMTGTRGKINAIWWNIKINLQKSVDICRYELPTNLQNFT